MKIGKAEKGLIGKPKRKRKVAKPTPAPKPTGRSRGRPKGAKDKKPRPIVRSRVSIAPQINKRKKALQSVEPDALMQKIEESLDFIMSMEEIREAGWSREEVLERARANPVAVMAMVEEAQQLARRTYEEAIKLKVYEDTHRTVYFEPQPHQQKFIDYIRDGKKTVLMVGANQIGKTVTGVNIVGTFCTGCKVPWGEKYELYPSTFARENNGKGVQGRIVVKDWEKSARDTFVPKLKEWLCLGDYETKKNNVGVEYEWVFSKTGSKFTFVTHGEDTMSQEGWTGDFVLFDEPPPRDKYIANLRGLIARGGVAIFTMTAISEPWILDEIVLTPQATTGIISDIPIRANKYLAEEEIRRFEDSLTEDEKVARIKGGWLQLTGRIWKGFYPTPRLFDDGRSMCHVQPYFPVPTNWPVQFQIDFHLTEPHAISFTACDEYGRFWVCEEVWENCSTEELADTIIRMRRQNGWRLDYGEIDPLSKGDTSYIRNRFGRAEDSFTIIKNRLKGAGIRLGVGSKDEKSYIKEVEKRLRGVNGPEPTLYIMDNCRETIKQVTRWSYDDNGKPRSDGHFPECIGRQTQTGLRYTDPDEVVGVDYSALLNKLNTPLSAYL